MGLTWFRTDVMSIFNGLRPAEDEEGMGVEQVSCELSGTKSSAIR